MIKETFLKLDNSKITVDMIEEIYEYSLNTAIDYVNEVCIDSGKITIFYYCDDEPSLEIFSSIDDLKFKLKTHGK